MPAISDACIRVGGLPVSKAKRPKDDHSITLLDHLRWFAACLVCLSHIGDMVVRPSQKSLLFNVVTGYGHQSVVIFFVLSGFLIGEKIRDLASSYSTDRLKHYLAHRAGRIFIVLIPALIFSGIAYLVIMNWLNTSPIVGGRWSISTFSPLLRVPAVEWLCHAFLLNEFACPTIGIDAPLWSLSYEWSYYIVSAGILALLLDRSRFGGILSVYALVLCLAIVFDRAAFVGALIWTAGAASGQISRVGLVRTKWALLISFGFFVSMVVYSYSNHGLLSDLLLGLGLSGLLANQTLRRVKFASELGARLAGFSYSLYCTHFPLLILLISYVQHVGVLNKRLDLSVPIIATIIALLLICIAFAYCFSLFTEVKTPLIVRWLYGFSTRSAADRTALQSERLQRLQDQ